MMQDAWTREMVEKNTPKPPKMFWYQSAFVQFGELQTRCPTCDELFAAETKNAFDSYTVQIIQYVPKRIFRCYKCGQRIDWTGDLDFERDSEKG